MALDYVFGPVKAVDTLLNINLQFHMVRDTQEEAPNDRGFAWSSDDDDLNGDCTDGCYDGDIHTAIKDMTDALRERIYEAWREKQEANLDRRVLNGVLARSKKGDVDLDVLLAWFRPERKPERAEVIDSLRRLVKEGRLEEMGGLYRPAAVAVGG